MRTNFFKDLPRDVFLHFTQWLHLQGPRVKLIKEELSDDQKKLSEVLAVSGSDSQNPDLGVYHLIMCNSPSGNFFKIGFCKRAEDNSLFYKTKILDSFSPLRHYVSEDLIDPDYSRIFKKGPDSREPLLLKLMTLEINIAGGLTQVPLRNSIRLASVCQYTRALISNKRAFLDNLLFHIVYGEELEARKILEIDPSLLLSNNHAPVTSCSPEIHYFSLPAFQLAVVTHHWPIYEMMLKIIDTSVHSEIKQAEYKADLRMQLEDIENFKVHYTVDNLFNRALQILDAEKLNNDDKLRMKYERSIIRNNSYHLIIQTILEMNQRKVISCVLGFRKSAEYVQYEVPPENPLFAIAGELYQKLKNASDGYGNAYGHFFTRRPRDLKLVEDILQQQGVKTVRKEDTTGRKFRNLKRELERYHENPSRSYRHAIEKWHGLIGSNARLLTACLWQFWMCELLPQTTDVQVMKDFLLNTTHIALVETFAENAFPLSSSMGNSFYLWRPKKHWQLHGLNQDLKVMSCFLSAFLEVAEQKRLKLYEAVKDYSSPDPLYENLYGSP